MASESELAAWRKLSMQQHGLGTFQYKFDGTVVYMDSVTLRIFDLENTYTDTREIVGRKKLKDLIIYTWPEGSVRSRVKELGHSYGEVYHFKTLSGHERWVVHDDYLIQDPVSGEDLIRTVIRDVTAQKQAEAALRESEQTYRNLFHNAQVGLFRTKLGTGVLLECNDTLAKMLGYEDRTECVNGFKLDGVYVDPGIREKMFELIREHGEFSNYEARFFRKDASIVWIRYSGKYSREHGWLEGVAEDITDIKRVEEEKRELQEKLNRSKQMEAMGMLAGGVAHDLNNILSGIISYPELILRQLEKDSTLREPLEAIRESGSRAAMVVADLLTIARTAASVREPHDINRIIAESLESPECRQLNRLYPEVGFQTRLDSEIPNISCSPVHIKKCLVNLVTNGVEAIEGEGSVCITTTVHSADDIASGWSQCRQASEYIMVTIQDSGQGINKDDLEHIFEPFYSRKIMGRSGTGLGLAVVWNTVQSHDGEVVVESGDNGTCFKLLFPATREENSRQREEPETEQYKGNGETILVVDDEPQLRDIACKILATIGYAVDSVDSGEKAIEYLGEKTVDLVLLDMIMNTGLNGCQAYEEIIQIRPGQKALIASGFSKSEDVDVALRLGVGGFLKKPYSMEQLSKAVFTELAR